MLKMIKYLLLNSLFVPVFDSSNSASVTIEIVVKLVAVVVVGVVDSVPVNELKKKL